MYIIIIIIIIIIAVIVHSNPLQVSAANYEARAFGIRAGMLISAAKRACPDLLVMPYQFDRYTEVSQAAFCILCRHTALVQTV